MKLVFAIVNDDDASRVLSVLNRAGFPATKLASTGGYLKSGNTTFISGVQDEQVDEVLSLIGKNAHKRKQIIHDTSTMGAFGAMAMPLEIEVGGATVFVINVERYEKL
ncbi:MAG: cyclic-di-AMP receptor [Clostridia bacterium]|nr:cyclic-di-AMP receptor [Clostridia bacterium]